MTENLIIFNARVVTPIGFSARCGKEMGELCIIDNATIEVTDGIISYVGPSRGEMRDGYYQRYWHYNARGKCLLPGFVDSHTHFVFGGDACKIARRKRTATACAECVYSERRRQER